MTHFADRVTRRVDELGHPLCVGLDPHLDRIPSRFHQGGMRRDEPATLVAVETFLNEVVDRLENRVAIVKPQAALFEALGPRGYAMLARVVNRCRQRGLMVLLDAKRGDIGSTATAYAQAYLAPDAPLPVDALTVNPFLGLETLDPFVEACEQSRGVFVLVKTSNPGSMDLQGLTLQDGTQVYLQLATRLRGLERRLKGERWSALGVVVGATFPEEAKAVRARLPDALCLVPGYGAQGATAADAVASFVREGGQLRGGLVNASRSILFPSGTNWEAAFERALATAIEDLHDATH